MASQGSLVGSSTLRVYSYLPHHTYATLDDRFFPNFSDIPSHDTNRPVIGRRSDIWDLSGWVFSGWRSTGRDGFTNPCAIDAMAVTLSEFMQMDYHIVRQAFRNTLSSRLYLDLVNNAAAPGLVLAEDMFVEWFSEDIDNARALRLLLHATELMHGWAPHRLAVCEHLEDGYHIHTEATFVDLPLDPLDPYKPWPCIWIYAFAGVNWAGIPTRFFTGFTQTGVAIDGEFPNTIVAAPNPPPNSPLPMPVHQVNGVSPSASPGTNPESQTMNGISTAPTVAPLAVTMAVPSSTDMLGMRIDPVLGRFLPMPGEDQQIMSEYLARLPAYISNIHAAGRVQQSHASIPAIHITPTTSPAATSSASISSSAIAVETTERLDHAQSHEQSEHGNSKGESTQTMTTSEAADTTDSIHQAGNLENSKSLGNPTMPQSVTEPTGVAGDETMDVTEDSRAHSSESMARTNNSKDTSRLLTSAPQESSDPVPQPVRAEHSEPQEEPPQSLQNPTEQITERKHEQQQHDDARDDANNSGNSTDSSTSRQRPKKKVRLTITVPSRSPSPALISSPPRTWPRRSSRVANLQLSPFGSASTSTNTTTSFNTGTITNITPTTTPSAPSPITPGRSPRHTWREMHELPLDARNNAEAIIARHPDAICGNVLLWLISRPPGGNYTITQLADRITAVHSDDQRKTQLHPRSKSGDDVRSRISHRKKAALEMRAESSGRTYREEVTLFDRLENNDINSHVNKCWGNLFAQTANRRSSEDMAAEAAASATAAATSAATAAVGYIPTGRFRFRKSTQTRTRKRPGASTIVATQTHTNVKTKLDAMSEAATSPKRKRSVSATVESPMHSTETGAAEAVEEPPTQMTRLESESESKAASDPVFKTEPDDGEMSSTNAEEQGASSADTVQAAGDKAELA